MIVVGIDAHKRTHTLVAVDAVGCKLAEKTIEATTDGHIDGMNWAHQQFGTDLLWGMEDPRHLVKRLEFIRSHRRRIGGSLASRHAGEQHHGNRPGAV